MKKLYLAIVILCLFCNAFGHASSSRILGLYERYQSIVGECGDCLHTAASAGELEYIRTMRSGLRELIREAKALNMDNLVSDYLQMLASIKINEIEQLFLEYEKPGWADAEQLGNFKGSIKTELVNWQRKYPNSEVVWQKADALSQREQQWLLVMAPGNGADEISRAYVKSHLWPLLSETIPQRRRQAEELLFRFATPEKSIRQLEIFVTEYGPYTQDHHSHLLWEAFEAYYLKYTASGELSTLLYFPEMVRAKNLPTWDILLEKLKASSRYRDDLALAREADEVVNADVFHAFALDGFARKAAPRESAFVAVKRLVAHELQEGRLETGIQLAESFQPYFTDRPLYERVESNFKTYLYNLKKIAPLRSEWACLPVEALNTPGDEIRFIRSKFGQFLATVPHYPNQPIRIFEKSGSSWQYLDQQEHNTNFVHLFTDKELKDGEGFIELIPATSFYSHGNVNNFFGRKDVMVLDHYISYRHGIVLFVTTSDYQRLTSPEEDAPEYHSPWHNGPKSSLQVYGSSIGFHGKVHGNGNFDIYYSFILDSGRAYSKPKPMGSFVNTPYCERSPILSRDGNTLYFASEGHHSLGGLDVFRVSVKIDESQKKIIPTGNINNITEVNSTADDLYYFPVSKKQEKEQETYFSSNRGGNFNLYTLKKASGAGLSQDGPRKFFEWPNGSQIKLEMECRREQHIAEITPPNTIHLIGRIYDSRERLVKNADISFFNIDGTGNACEVGSDGRYMVTLSDDQRYKITIRATTVDDEELTEYLDTFINVCPNPVGDQLAIRDFRTNEIVEGMQTGFDFFYDTDRYASTVSNLDVLKHHYRRMIEGLARDTSIRLKLVGYADERGEGGHNLLLARGRVGTANKYLRSWGFDEEWLQLIPKGETHLFDDDDFFSLKDILPPYTRHYDEQERKWQMNRRVHILFSVKPAEITGASDKKGAKK